MKAGKACVTNIEVFAVKPPNIPATTTQARKKSFTSRRARSSPYNRRRETVVQTLIGGKCAVRLKLSGVIPNMRWPIG